MAFFISFKINMNKMLVKQDSKYYLSILSLVMLVFILVIYFYGPVFFHPNEYLFNDTGDSYKNYFTYEWHVQNDHSFIDYSGSNYPYGENHLFTDGTPLLSNLIKAIPFLKPYSIGIFNFTMLLSLFICAIILFKIFKLFNIENWKAVLSALGITVLCPQALRYAGHFALSYGFCIPLIIYLLLMFSINESNKLKLSVIIAIASFSIFFIHPYLGMICATFCFFYWLFKIVFNFKRIKYHFIHFILQALIPLLAYYMIVKLTDAHVDRNAKPYGFFYFTSSIETIFISTHKPFRHLLSQLYKITSQNGEGIAYVGISTLIILIWCIFIIKSIGKKAYEAMKVNEKIKNYSFMILSSIVMLFFSMGFPFNAGMEWILDYVPTIQQFRSPGRFAWIFYFVTTIGICVIISKHSFARFPLWLKNSCIGLLLILFTIEGIPYHNEVTKAEFPKNSFNQNELNDEYKTIISCIKKIKPQAIIPLPFFHIGTDYYDISGTGNITNSSFVISLHSKTPLMANLTPRNSLTEAEKLIQVVSNDVLYKNLKGSMLMDKPIVILYNKESLTDEEYVLLQKGTKVIETNNYIVKEITMEQLFYNSSSDKIAFYNSKKSNMIFYKGFLMTDSAYFYFNDFNTLPNDYYQANVNDTNLIFEVANNTLKKEVPYEISFWYSTRDKLDMNNKLVITELDSYNNSTIIALKNVNSMQNIYNGKTLATLTFVTKNPQNKIKISLNGASDREKVFYLDDLMIRQKNVNVFKSRYSAQLKDSIINYNNLDLLMK